MKILYLFFLTFLLLNISGRRVLHRHHAQSKRETGVFNIREHVISDFDVPDVLKDAASSAGLLLNKYTPLINDTTKEYQVPTRDPFTEDFRVYAIREVNDSPGEIDAKESPVSPPGKYTPLCSHENVQPHNIQIFQAGEGAFCSGFLVSPNIVVTAGHCVNRLPWRDSEGEHNSPEELHPCDDTAIIINYKPRSIFYDSEVTRRNVASFSQDQVYWCKKAISRSYSRTENTNPMADYGVIELDRDVPHTYQFVKVQPPTNFFVNETIHGMKIAGFAHPQGLSELYDPDGVIIEPKHSGREFTAVLDGEGGSSGGLIASTDTGMAVGIQIAGPIGWQLKDVPSSFIEESEDPKDRGLILRTRNRAPSTLEATGKCYDRIRLTCADGQSPIHCTKANERTLAASTEQFYEFIDHKPIRFSQSLAAVNEKEGSARIKALQKLVGCDPADGKWDDDLKNAINTKARATHKHDGRLVVDDPNIIAGPPKYPNSQWDGNSVEIPLLSMWLCQFDLNNNQLTPRYPNDDACSTDNRLKSILAARELLRNGYTTFPNLSLEGDADNDFITALKTFSTSVGYIDSDFKGLNMGLWRHLWSGVTEGAPTYAPETI